MEFHIDIAALIDKNVYEYRKFNSLAYFAN